MGLKVVANGSSEDKEVLIRNNKIVATVVEKYEERGYLVARGMFVRNYKFKLISS